MGQGQGSITNNQKRDAAGALPPVIVTGAQNGTNITVTPNVVELGGALIRDTDITGILFKLAFTNNCIGIGVTAASLGTNLHKLRVQHLLGAGNPQDGAASILAQSLFTITNPNSLNFYGIVGALVLNLAGGIIGNTNTWNATGVGGSLRVVGNNGSPSTRRLRALMGGVGLDGNALVNDIASIEARTVEGVGTNTVTNLYGLYIDTQAFTGVTNSWGIFQASTQDVNFFNGTIRATGGIRADGFLNSAVGGVAIEIFITGSVGYIKSYNRTLGAAMELNVQAANYKFTDVSGGSTAFYIEGNTGRIYGSAIHNNGNLPVGTANQYIASGTYTPTLFNTTNVAASNAYESQWIRVGNVVTVSGKIDIDPTAAASTLLGLSLPIPSQITTEQQISGCAVTQFPAQDAARIMGDVANDRASISYTSISLNNINYSFHFTYLIN